ncbi:MAG: DUF2167 domain-containing protein [Myxococcota bacterium]
MRIATTLALASGLAILATGPVAPAGAQEAEGPMPSYHQGPGTFPIDGELAAIDLDESYLFLDAENSRKLMEIYQNPSSEREAATVIPASQDENWYLIFEWEPMGYVEDADAELDADVILQAIRESTAAANEEREKRGWATMQIAGWHEPPSYDSSTNHLTWSIIGESEGQKNVNYIVKLLGRRGVMTATLVASPDELPLAAAQTNRLLTHYRFQAGHSYAEFVPGDDQLAEIGLAALIVGGAGAALVKSGLLARFWKFIVLGVVGLGAAIKRFFFGTRAEDQPITSV